MGDGPGEPDSGEGDEVGVTDGVGVTEGEAERAGLAERPGCGVRDGLGDAVPGAGLDEDGAGLDAGTGWVAAAGAGVAGLTRMYSAKVARNRTVSTTVEVRGRAPVRCLTRRPRSRGRYRGRRRR